MYEFFSYLCNLQVGTVNLHTAMNKTQLVEAMALDAGLSKVEARKAVDAMLRVTMQTLQEGDKVTLSGFGTFNVHQKPASIGRNPRTGAAVKIAARKVVRFRPAIEIE